MKYMIIERFYSSKLKDLYLKLEQEGRLLPNGVTFINSFIDEKVQICFQIIESDSISLIHQWIEHWTEYADFEIFPVISSAEAKDKVLKQR